MDFEDTKMMWETIEGQRVKEGGGTRELTFLFDDHVFYDWLWLSAFPFSFSLLLSLLLLVSALGHDWTGHSHLRVLLGLVC